MSHTIYSVASYIYVDKKRVKQNNTLKNQQ